MTVKNTKNKVRHFIVAMSMDGLNEWLGEKLDTGFDYVDAKIVHIDPNNQIYTVFYILKKIE